jgi:hypothetical protein
VVTMTPDAAATANKDLVKRQFKVEIPTIPTG